MKQNLANRNFQPTIKRRPRGSWRRKNTGPLEPPGPADAAAPPPRSRSPARPRNLDRRCRLRAGCLKARRSDALPPWTICAPSSPRGSHLCSWRPVAPALGPSEAARRLRRESPPVASSRHLFKGKTRPRPRSRPRRPSKCAPTPCPQAHESSNPRRPLPLTQLSNHSTRNLSTCSPQLSTLNPQPASSSPLPCRWSSAKKRTPGRVGCRAKGHGARAGSQASSLKGIVWVGVGLFVFGLASLVWPPLKVVIASVTTSAALMLGGVALMVLPSLVVGNELLILGGVGLAVGGWFLAHRHGQLRGIVAASSQPNSDQYPSHHCPCAQQSYPVPHHLSRITHHASRFPSYEHKPFNSQLPSLLASQRGLPRVGIFTAALLLAKKLLAPKPAKPELISRAEFYAEMVATRGSNACRPPRHAGKAGRQPPRTAGRPGPTGHPHQCAGGRPGPRGRAHEQIAMQTAFHRVQRLACQGGRFAP